MEHLWNPYSLLHIPLYGILMLLLSSVWGARRHLSGNPSVRLSSFLFPGGICFLIGILDEVNQIFIPHRVASIKDIFLNLTGMVMAFFLIRWWNSLKLKKKAKSC